MVGDFFIGKERESANMTEMEMNEEVKKFMERVLKKAEINSKRVSPFERRTIAEIGEIIDRFRLLADKPKGGIPEPTYKLPMPQPEQQLHKVKQLLTVNSIKSANIFLASGNWILVNSYKNYRMQYVLGRIWDY